MKKTIATLIIHGPGKMTPQGRTAIVRWLVKLAKDVDSYGDTYTKQTFRARYYYYADSMKNPFTQKNTTRKGPPVKSARPGKPKAKAPASKRMNPRGASC